MRVAYGIDALQSLSLAVERARMSLDAMGLVLTWEGGEPGDMGIPRQVLALLGRARARQRITSPPDSRPRARRPTSQAMTALPPPAPHHDRAR